MRNELVKINNQEITVKIFNNKRVVTFKDIDLVHNRPEGTAKRNFNANKKHFIEGEDYFKVPFNYKSVNEQSLFDFATRIKCNSGIDYAGFIYIAVDPQNRLLKIGRTKNKIQRRISSLNVGRSKKITEYEYFNCKDTLKAEKNIHKLLSDFQRTGEWFEISIDEARDVIKREIEKIDQGYKSLKRYRILFTESGYSMIVKSFTDELAWEVQRQLINNYFKASQCNKKDKYNIDEKSKLLEAKLINARVEMANMYYKLSNVETLSKEHKNILVSKASEVLSGQEIIVQ